MSPAPSADLKLTQSATTGSTPPLVLIVEDDEAIVTLLEYNLQAEGFRCAIAYDGDEAVESALALQPALILLDWMLPHRSGIEVCRQLRAYKETAGVPIIMLTARGEEEDMLRGLSTGADDYVTKPFSPRELIARARALLRRSTPAFARDRIECGPIAIDLIQHRATRDGEALPLSPTEYRLLIHLVQSPGQVFGREQLLNRVWGYDKEIDQRTVDVHIRRLRKVLNKGGKPDLIRTVREYGYAFDDENAAAA